MSVKFHLNIPHSKRTTGKKHILIQSRADNSKNGKGKSDGSKSQYVTFDVKHICEVIFRYSI